LWSTLARRGDFIADGTLKHSLPKIVLSSLIMGIALWFAADALDPWLRGDGALIRFSALTALVVLGFAVYAVAVQLTGAMPLKRLKAGFRRNSAGPV
jgi:putative peptidoglycan lipid II flippase